MATPTEEESLQLSVSNFGPIAKAEIDLRPLTVFVGPSNTGKSYLAILIYTLHKFFDDYPGPGRFGFHLRHGMRRQVTKQQSFDEDKIKTLVRWMREVFGQEFESQSASSLIPLPDFIESMVRPLISELIDISPIIVGEIERSFGIEDTTRLIRHGNREGAKITLNNRISATSDYFKSFEYDLVLRRGHPEKASISISEETPLYIDPQTKKMAEVLFHARDVMETVALEDNDGGTREVAYFIRALSSSVLSNFVSPLNRAAHYLPANRTGVMHSHRALVASLIERASHAGLQHDTLLPTLSGVLADFLAQLIELGEPRRRRNNQPRRRRNNKGDLATSLEQQILRGEIRIENSEAGYPMFSYQPQGWKGEDLPLMNTSSMVSELAPVVLYLRHIVQPGDVLIIEEPESHLHPAMQVEFVRHLAAVVNSGVRVMLTTHSEWVLDELTNLVRLSDLPKRRREGIASGDFALNPDEVGVWLFEPKQRPKGSVVKEIRVDEEFGGFRSGFDEVAMGTYNDYAKISNRIERRSVHDESH